MSSSKSVEKTGIRKISVLLSPVKSSKVGTISTSEIRENEKTMLRKYDLFNKEFLSNDFKNHKKARKSLLTSKERKKLEALEVASNDFQQNGSNANENKKAGKKIKSLKKRASRSSTLPGKSKRASTICSLSDGEALLLKEFAIGNEVTRWNNKSVKRQSYASKRKKVSNIVHGKDSDLKNLSDMQNLVLKDVSVENKLKPSNTKLGKRQSRESKKKRGSNLIHGKVSDLEELSDGKYLVLNDLVVENKQKPSNNEADRRQPYVPKKRRASYMIHGKDSDLEELSDGQNLVMKDAAVAYKLKPSNKKAGKRQSCVSKKKRESNLIHGKVSDVEELSDGKSLVLKDLVVENKLKASNNKASKRQSYVSKKRRVSNIIHGKDLDLEQHKMLKNFTNRKVTTEEMDKENYKFESEAMQYERSKIVMMPEVEQEKRNARQAKLKSPVVKKIPIDLDLEPAEILKSKYKLLYLDYRPKKSKEKVFKISTSKRETPGPKRKEAKPSRRCLRISIVETEKVRGIPVRRSMRIAAMQRSNLLNA